MYIEPNTTIKLLRDVPLDKNQTDTLWFAGLSEQLSYFNGKVVKTFSNVSFQRKTRGVCRIQVAIGEVYNVNYMLFQNSSFSNKWFFAFVDEVEYVNNNTVEVRYSIDPVQTWLFQIEMGQTFVERETVADDTIGLHIEPENVELGEYTINGDYLSTVPVDDENMRIVVMYYEEDFLARQHFYGRVFTMPTLYTWSADLVGALTLTDWITRLGAKISNIYGIYMCPQFAVGTNSEPQQEVDRDSTGGILKVLLPTVSDNDTIDGHTVQNKKLFTYPYNYLSVDSPTSQTLPLRFEFFNGTPMLQVTCSTTYPVEMACYPLNYKGITSDPTPNVLADEYRIERISFSGYPLCPFGGDSYDAWLSQNSVPRLLNLGTTVAGGILGVTGANAVALANQNRAIGNTITNLNNRPQPMNLSNQAQLDVYNTATRNNAIMSTVGNITGILGEAYRASHASDICRGSVQVGSNDYASKRMTFKYGRMSIKRQYAERIDKYFTMFGYKVGIAKDVNIHQRSRFTYVKTVGANVHGALPSDDAEYIANCFDSGIRFWADHAGINNYDAPNNTL